MAHRPAVLRFASTLSVAVLLALALAGCGGGSGASEPPEGDVPAGTVDIDPDGDGVTFTDPDGVTTSVGDGSLPEDWPDDLVPPDTVTIVTSSTQSSAEETSMYVIGSTDATVEETYAAVDAMLVAGGYTVENQTLLEDPDAPYGAFMASKGATTVSATVAPGADGSGVELSVSVTIPA